MSYLNEEIEKDDYLKAEEECAREPIHIPGSIQPYACFMVLSADLKIMKYSENLSAFFDIAIKDIPSKTIADFFDASSVSDIQRMAEKPEISPHDFLIVSGKKAGQLYCLNLQKANDMMFLEIEKSLDDQMRTMHSMSLVCDFAEQLIQLQTLSEQRQFLLDKVRELTDHDRIYFYQFDAAWNGEVVNESRKEGQQSYLNIHFPASDIPQQARDLYYKKKIRYVPDTYYKPSLILPDDKAEDGKQVDLSLIHSRSI